MSVEGVVALTDLESLLHLIVNNRGIDVAPCLTHLPHVLHLLWDPLVLILRDSLLRPSRDYLLDPLYL